MGFELSIIGLFVGILIGVSGIGGGAIMAPILIFLGIGPSYVVGADLFYSFLTKFVGGFYHWKNNKVDLGITKDLLLGSIPFSLLGVLVHKYFQIAFGEVTIRNIIGVVLLFVSVFILVRAFWKVSPCETRFSRVRRCRKKVLFIIGSIVGFLVGLTSVGSGTLILSSLFLIFPKLSLSKIVSTDIFHGFLMVSGAAFLHLFLGNVNFFIVGYILLGSIPGVILGSNLAFKLNEGFLAILLASLLALSGVKML